MSKFEFGLFYGGYDEFVVSAERFTKEQATDIFEIETNGKVGEENGQFRIARAYVTHRAGVDEDGEPQVGWWLEYKKRPKRSVKVWAFCRLNDWTKEKKFPDCWDEPLKEGE